MKTAFVTGATGLLGGNLAKMLIEQGVRVKAIRRSEKSSSHLSQIPIEWISGDLSDGDALRKGITGVDAVFHCAAAVAFTPASYQKAYEVNVLGTKNLLQVCKEFSTARLVYCSTVAALGLPSGNGASSETDIYNWDLLGFENTYSKTKYLAEKWVLESVKDIDAVIVNPGTMFGALDAKPSSGQLLLSIAKKEIPAYPSGINSFVNVEDVVKGMILAWQKGRRGERYILSGHNLSYEKFFSLVAQLADVRPPRLPLPRPLAMIGGAFGSAYSALTKREVNLNISTIQVAYLNHSFDSSKAVKELGYVFEPIEIGIAKALSYFRETRKLPSNQPHS